MTFSIRNWARFQHYTKRHPPWIKLYHDLLDDDDFAELSHFTQLLYFKLLMAASRKDNRIPESVTWMATELSLPRGRVKNSLAELLDSGFLASTDASDPASKRASNGASGIASASRAPARSRESEQEQETEINPRAVAVDAARDDEPDLDLPSTNGNHAAGREPDDGEALDLEYLESIIPDFEAIEP